MTAKGTHYTQFGGNIKSGAGTPDQFILTDDVTEIGDLFLDTSHNRLYTNTDGTTTGWHYTALITTSTSSSSTTSTSSSTSSSTSTSSSSSSSTTTMA